MNYFYRLKDMSVHVFDRDGFKILLFSIPFLLNEIFP